MVAARTPRFATCNPINSRIKHVLLISVDGLHQQDLAWYVRTHPGSVLAGLERHGLEYSNASTPFPADSFPGLIGQVTGGDPGVGGEVAYTEADDLNQNRLDAGQGLHGLPGSILRMTSSPLKVINPAALPVNPRTCKPILPSQYLKVNTIFNVAAER